PGGAPASRHAGGRTADHRRRLLRPDRGAFRRQPPCPWRDGAGAGTSRRGDRPGALVMTRTLVLLLMLAGVAACGVKGDPAPPEGEEALYRLGDRQYPAPHTVVPPRPETPE